MKRVLTAAAALSILAGPAVSLAQDHHDEHGGGGHPAGGGAQHAAPAAAPAAPARGPQGGPPGGYHPAPQGAAAGGNHPQPQYQGAQPGYRPQGGAPAGGYQAQGRPGYQGQPGYRGAPGGAQQGYQGRPGPGGPGGRGPGDRGPGDRGPRAGAQAFGVGGRTFYRYHGSPYAYPGGYGGWGNHYWRRGEFLPSVFFLPNYFINDYWSYGLWAPDYGYQWIRVGADALLINLATGEVVDSVPGIYY